MVLFTACQPFARFTTQLKNMKALGNILFGIHSTSLDGGLLYRITRKNNLHLNAPLNFHHEMVRVFTLSTTARRLQVFHSFLFRYSVW